MGNSKYVLVTGGAGYIGSHACKELAKNGYMPVVYDNLSTGHHDFVKWGEFVQGDLLDISRIKEVFSKYEFLGVIHFAAKAYVGESVNNPIKYFRENIGGLTNLLDVASDSNIRAFILSSSCATYGTPQVELISENTNQNPINPYGFSKLACEKLLEAVSLISKFNFSILRYFNAAGADPDLELGELHDEETHAIPLLIRAGIEGKTFEIFGDDYPTNDGTAVRDYVHVSDLATAHVAALNFNLDKNENLICNLGSGVGTSVKTLTSICKSFFPSMTIATSRRRIGDPPKLIADVTVARERLGWEPQYSDIETIFSTATAWVAQVQNKQNRL